MDTTNKKVSKATIVKALTLIRTYFMSAYRNNIKNKDVADECERLLIDTWYNSFKGYTEDLFWAALERNFEQSEFAPTIASIKKQITAILRANSKSDFALWREIEDILPWVYEAQSCFGHTLIEENGKTQGRNARERVEEKFYELSKETQYYLVDSTGLIRLSKMSDKQIEIEKARFFRMIDDIRDTLSVISNNDKRDKIEHKNASMLFSLPDKQIDNIIGTDNRNWI